MSLLPLLFNDVPLRRPARWSSSLADPDDILPLAFIMQQRAPASHRNLHAEGDRNTAITVDKDHFTASIDIQQFRPEEVSVKLTDNDKTITVEGKHEERQDEHGYISRHFVRKYKIPEDVDVQKLKSKLSSDGVLSIVAPKKQQKKEVQYTEIPIIRTGEPVKKPVKVAEEEEQAKKKAKL